MSVLVSSALFILAPWTIVLKETRHCLKGITKIEKVVPQNSQEVSTNRMRHHLLKPISCCISIVSPFRKFTFSNLCPENERKWERKWNDVQLTNSLLRLQWLDINRGTWTQLNRIRTKHGRCNYMLSKWRQTIPPASDFSRKLRKISGSFKMIFRMMQLSGYKILT